MAFNPIYSSAHTVHIFILSALKDWYQTLTLLLLCLFIHLFPSLFVSSYSEDPPALQGLWPVLKCSADFFFSPASRATVNRVNAAQSLCIVQTTYASALQKQRFPSSAWFMGRKYLLDAHSISPIFHIFMNVSVSARLRARERVKEGEARETHSESPVNSIHRLLLYCDWISQASICALAHTQTHTLIGYYSQVQNPSEGEAVVNQARLRCKTNVLSVLQPQDIEMPHGCICMFFL